MAAKSADEPVCADKLEFSLWKRVKNHLSETAAMDDDLVKLGIVFGDCLSPLPSSMTTIDMKEPFVLEKFIENIVWNFYNQKLELRYLTWKNIGWLFDMVSDECTPSGEKVLQILLTLSKLSADEYFQWHSAPKRQLTPNSLFDRFLLRPSLDCLVEITHNESIALVDGKYFDPLKTFLLQPVIISTLSDGLEKVELRKDDEWIRNAISGMNIWFTARLLADICAFNGLTLRDGILIVTTEQNLESLASDGTKGIREKAKLFTVAVHETAHYLARLAAGDFNFSSPGKGWREVTLFDEEYPEKPFELGRYVELRLFGGIQPNWLLSRPEAAAEFINNARMCKLPLVHQRPHDDLYLRQRFIPSLSFAGDLEISIDLTI